MVKNATPLVNAKFKEAVDALCVPMSHQELADELDCSVAVLRAALRDPKSPAHRKPPSGWEMTVRRLVQARADHLAQFAQRLKVRE